MAQEVLPVWLPRAGLIAAHDFPGHRDGTATIEHTDGQHREAIGERTGVHGQGEAMLAGIPPTQDPAQEGSKTTAHLQGLAMRPFFVLAGVAPFAQALSHGRLRLLEQRGQDGSPYKYRFLLLSPCPRS